MAVKTYIMMLFGISVALYLLGYTSPFLEILSQTGVEESGSASIIWNNIINNFLSVFSNPILWTTMAVPIVGSILMSGSSGQSSYFVIPLLVLTTVLANFFVLPTTYIFSAEIPTIVKIIVNSFLNLFLLLTIIEFVTGRG